MRLALVTNIFPPHTRGGYELGCRDIARALAAAGHDVHIVTSLSVGSLRKTAEVRDLAVHEIFEPVFGFEAELGAAMSESPAWQHDWMEALGGVHYGNAVALARWLQATRPDVVWLFNPIGIGPVGIFEAALSTAAPVVLLLMDDIDACILRPQRNMSWVPRFRRLKSRIDAVSCSDNTRAANRAIGDYRSHTVVYNGMRFPLSPPPPAGGGERFSFCCIGQIEEAKGLLEMVRAARALCVERPELSFEIHIYGSGNRLFRERLIAEVRQAGLTAHIIFHGFVEKADLLRRIRQHDAALLLLRDHEPFGYTPLEAAVCGLPAIVTATAGAMECVRRGYPLLVDRRDDATGVARLMAWCLDHREQLPAIARQLYDDFQARCDFEAVTLPGYMSAIAHAPRNDGPTSIASLIASCRTADFYAQSRVPFERLYAAAHGETADAASLTSERRS